MFQHRAGSQEITRSAECTRATVDITGRKRGEVQKSLGRPGEATLQQGRINEKSADEMEKTYPWSVKLRRKYQRGGSMA